MRHDKTERNDYTGSLNGDVGDAVRASGGVLLGGEVGVDVDLFDGAGRVAHWQDLFGVPADAVVAVGDDPAFRPEGVVQGGGEFVNFGFVDVGAPAVFVQLAGFALDGDMLPVGAAHGDGIDADVLLGSAGEVGIALRPFGPAPAAGDVPFADVGRDVGG